jgi:hypothetical protein
MDRGGYGQRRFANKLQAVALIVEFGDGVGTRNKPVAKYSHRLFMKAAEYSMTL